YAFDQERAPAGAPRRGRHVVGQPAGRAHARAALRRRKGLGLRVGRRPRGGRGLPEHQSGVHHGGVRPHAPAPQAWRRGTAEVRRIVAVSVGRVILTPPVSNWLFARSLRGGQRAAASMNLTLSERLNGHDPYAYLKDVLTRLPAQLAIVAGQPRLSIYGY